MHSPADRIVAEFPVADLVEQVEAFALRHPRACADRRGMAFVADGARLWPPAIAPRIGPGETIESYLGRLRQRPGQDAGERDELQFVLLLRAGAAALGCWAGERLLYHKALRTYVVRGNGKAQSTWLKTRGKSRYGSRLRLQNWQRLLDDVGERLQWSVEQFGQPERVFTAMPVRVASELWGAASPPPLARDDARLQRLAVHVHRPDFEELLRVRRWMARGRLELRSAP